MPAKSQKQQKLMGIVRGIQKGTVDPKDVSAKAAEMAKTMKPGEVKKYAATKHKGLPKKVKKEGAEDGSMQELYVVKMAHPGCTPSSLVTPIDPLSGISGTEIGPDQVHGVYPSADVAGMVAEKLCKEYEEGQRMLEEKKGTATEKLKKAIDKLEKKRKQHMDAMKEDPKTASEHKTSIADLATKIDDYLTKLEKIEKSKKAEDKKEKEAKKSIKENVNKRKVEDFKAGSIVHYENGEQWVVLKSGMRGSGEQKKSDEVYMKPHNKLAKEKHGSIAMDVSIDHLNSEKIDKIEIKK